MFPLCNIFCNKISTLARVKKCRTATTLARGCEEAPTGRCGLALGTGPGVLPTGPIIPCYPPVPRSSAVPRSSLSTACLTLPPAAPLPLLVNQSIYVMNPSIDNSPDLPCRSPFRESKFTRQILGFIREILWFIPPAHSAAPHAAPPLPCPALRSIPKSPNCHMRRLELPIVQRTLPVQQGWRPYGAGAPLGLPSRPIYSS